MVRKPLLLTLLLSAAILYADTGFKSTIGITETDGTPSCQAGQVKFSPGTVTCAGNVATVTNTGGGSGSGGSSTLETLFGTARSSPTATLKGSADFDGSTSGSTMTISLHGTNAGINTFTSSVTINNTAGLSVATVVSASSITVSTAIASVANISSETVSGQSIFNGKIGVGMTPSNLLDIKNPGGALSRSINLSQSSLGSYGGLGFNAAGTNLAMISDGGIYFYGSGSTEIGNMGAFGGLQMKNQIDMNTSNKIVNLANGTATTDAVNLGQVNKVYPATSTIITPSLIITGITNNPIQADGSGNLIGAQISLSTSVFGTLPVANGGTGTTTPGLVAGTNITSITGTWPNQTINAATQSGGGGGGAVLAVTTGSLTGFSVTIASPTAAINLDQAMFQEQLTGSATAFVTIAYSTTTQTASYTATSTSPYVSANCGSACTITLSTTSLNGSTLPRGFVFMIAQAGVGNVTVSPAAGTISGGSTALMNQQYSELDVIWDGNNYMVK